MKGSPVRVRASASLPWLSGVSCESRGEIGAATAVHTAAAGFVADSRPPRNPPHASVLVCVAITGFVAAIAAYWLSLAGDYGPLPHVHAALVAWIVLAYVGCGL